MPVFFFALPRELRDEIYDWFWLGAPATTLQKRLEFLEGAWYGNTASFLPSTIVVEGSKGLPGWLFACRGTCKEGIEAFVRCGSLRISLPKTQLPSFTPRYSHSEYLHNIRPGALLAKVRSIDVSLPLNDFRRVGAVSRYSWTGLQIAHRPCCLEGLSSHLSKAESLRNLGIAMTVRGRDFGTGNIHINLDPLKEMCSKVEYLERLTISADGRFSSGEKAVNFEGSLMEEMVMVVSVFPAGMLYSQEKTEEDETRVKWDFVFDFTGIMDGAEG